MSENSTPTSQEDAARDDAAPSTAKGTPDPSLLEKGTSSTIHQSQSTLSPSPSPSGDWQAIWSPTHGAYYFYNSNTQETTWINPLSSTESAQATQGSTATALQPEPEPVASSSKSLPTSSSDTPVDAAALGGIDPDLAYLDPSLAHLVSGSSSTSGPVPTFTAKFNARSGRFAPTDSRDPSHLSEYERAKRMSEAYFDVSAWEAQVAERDLRKKREAEEEAAGINVKKKRPTKADLERYREQKKERKMKKTAWLRN